MLEILFIVGMMTLPVLGLIKFDEWRARRRTRWIEGPLYDWANQVIDLTGGRR